MIDFEYKNKTYKIPSKWEDITLERYQDIYNTLKHLKENDEKEMGLTDRINLKIKLISAYTGIDVSTLKSIPYSKINNVIKSLDFLTKEIPSKSISTYVLHDIEYNVLTSLENRQFQDFVSLENALTMNDNDLVTNLHLILSIMSRKSIDETLDDYDIFERANELRSLDIVTAHNIGVFFYSLEKSYRKIMELYSNPKTYIEVLNQDLNQFSNNLVGRGWYTKLVAGIIMKYMRYYIRQQMKSLPSIQQNS